MGLGNALAPLAVQERLADRAASATGVYTTGIQMGSTVSAALAVPLAAALGGWRWALATFSLVTLGLLAAWLLLTATPPPGRGGAFPHAAAAGLELAGLAPRGDLLADGDVVLRAQRLVARRVHGERLDRCRGGAAARDDEPDGDPGLVRRAVAVGASRRAPSVPRRDERRVRHWRVRAGRRARRSRTAGGSWRASRRAGCSRS